MTRPYVKLSRRIALQMMGMAVAATSLTGTAAIAQADFPSRTITFICAFPAGSGADVLVRFLADKVATTSGQTIIVENKAGAAGNIAAEYVARADPDGYTVYVHAGSSTAMNYHLWNNPPLDPRTDLKGVAAINRQPFYILVPAQSPIQTIEELNAFLKEQGDKATYSTTATSGRVLGAAYINALGVNPVEVPYNNGPDALVDLLNGSLDFGVADPVFAMLHQADGTMRLLATGAGERMEIAPEIPTLVESGVDVAQIGWWAAWVPTGTPDEIVTKLNGMFEAALEVPETKAFLNSMGGDVWIASPEQVDEEMAKSVEEAESLVEIAKLPKN